MAPVALSPSGLSPPLFILEMPLIYFRVRGSLCLSRTGQQSLNLYRAQVPSLFSFSFFCFIQFYKGLLVGGVNPPLKPSLPSGGRWSLDPLFSSLRIRKRNNLKGKLKIKGKAGSFQRNWRPPPPQNWRKKYTATSLPNSTHTNSQQHKAKTYRRRSLLYTPESLLNTS